MEYYNNNKRPGIDYTPMEEEVTAHIECIRKITGYTFKDPDLVRGAIFAENSIYKGKQLSRATQLQLAKLGDELFKCVHHASNFPAATAKDEYMGDTWSWLTSNATLHFIAELSDLPQMLAESGHAHKIKTDGVKGFGTMIEAIFGAIYLDSGEDGAVTRTTMVKLLGTSMARKDVEQFHEKYRLQVRRPGPRTLKWHTMRTLANAKSQREETLLTNSEEVDVEERLQRWTQEVKKLTKAPARKGKWAARYRARQAQMLSGLTLREKVEVVKRNHARRLRKANGHLKPGGQKRSKIMLAWLEKAEERLRHGEEDFHGW